MFKSLTLGDCVNKLNKVLQGSILEQLLFLIYINVFIFHIDIYHLYFLLLLSIYFLLYGNEFTYLLI